MKQLNSRAAQRLTLGMCCLGAALSQGCGGRDAENVVVVQPPRQTTIIENQVAVAVTPTPKVVVAPAKRIVKKVHTEIIREKTIVVATPTPEVEMPEPRRSDSRRSDSPRPARNLAPAPTPSPTFKLVPSPTLRMARPAAGNSLVVQGEVLATSKVADPKSVPYSEALTFIKYKVLSVESGAYDGPEILVAHWGMKGKKLLPAARYRTGETHRLTLEPFDKHPELESVMQSDDTGAAELTPYWATNG